MAALRSGITLAGQASASTPSKAIGNWQLAIGQTDPKTLTGLTGPRLLISAGMYQFARDKKAKTRYSKEILSLPDWQWLVL